MNFTSVSYRKLIVRVQDSPATRPALRHRCRKIERELGWVPEESFEPGIRKTVIWCSGNLEWCRRVQDGNYQRKEKL